MTKIMIADDNSTTRKLLSKILESKGYEVAAFENGQEILDNFTEVKPDIVLLDVEMPVLSGIDACIELRKRKDAFKLPIAIISAKDNEDDIVEGLTSGADEYILKPIRRSEVLSKVSLLMSKKNAAMGKMSSNTMFAGKYKIIKTLGKGGFSIVYLAEDSTTKQLVALKVLDSANIHQKHISQFLREAYGLSLLDHPNIVTLIDFGSFGDKYYIVTEFIDGESFNDMIENQPVSEEFASFVGKKIVSALSYMSMRRIIHRDIKPDNILITKNGRVILVDFGLAKDQHQHTLSNYDEMQGTPHFMSPEYIRDEELNIECDIYSLGITLFYAITGEYPFNGSSMHIVHEHIDTAPPVLHKVHSYVSKPFSKMINRMLNKNPKKRISLAELTENLEYFDKIDSNDFTKEEYSNVKRKLNKEELDLASLRYHSQPTPGKIAIDLTKTCNNQEELSLAYSPGVAKPCLEIKDNIENVWKYTARSNFIAVVSDGSAVLGLGNIGPEAGMPVMEGKAVLFKSFADIDTVPICLGDVSLENGKSDPKAIIETVKRLEPSFGGINLEDIGAPACFEVEQTLKKTMAIPVFHDDQHGTAIISLAGIQNALKMTKKKLSDCKIVVNGAGAAGIACSEFYISAGAKRENFLMCDSKGVIYKGREGSLTPEKAKFVADTDARSLADAMVGADIFLGLSVAGAVTADMVRSMNTDPVIFAMANPTPEIFPDVALAAGAKIVGTGRTDFPNQVNNVLGFPGIFRGALDVRASNINEEMKIAAAKALAELVREPIDSKTYDILADAYPEDADNGMFDGKNPLKDSFVIPKPFDPRVVPRVAKYVAQAAMETGVAQIAIKDLDMYEMELQIRLEK